MNSASDIVELSEVFFRSNLELESEGEAVLAEEQVPTVLKAFADKVQASEEFTPSKMAALIKEVQKETGFKGKQALYANSCSLDWTDAWTGSEPNDRASGS